MTDESAALRANWAGWWIRRNPMYLMSAVFMAAGARLYLVSPGTRAGDIGLILLTLGILQAYEWAVTGILLAIHHWRRSPEDQPSLLLVAALFWTGPLAATAEMTAHRALPGLVCAVGACIIALWEMAAVHRLLGWRFSFSGRLAASACVVFLAVAPPLLRIPESVNGTNEVFLYASWWLLAIFALAGIVTVRHHKLRTGEAQREFALELAMLALVIGATAAHLSGMNYAYFGNAQWFYGAPLMIVVAMVVMEYVARLLPDERRLSDKLLMVLAGLLPVAAIVLARGRFDEHMPISVLPIFLRDPLTSTLGLAAIAWWFGFWRLRDPRLLHTGSLAMAWACLRTVRMFGSPTVTMQVAPSDPEAMRNLIVIGLYLAAAYLIGMALVRRSRGEAVAAIIVHQIAWTLMLWDRTPADELLVCISAGWAWLACMHLLGRPSMVAMAMPMLFLLVVTWANDFAPELCWHARSHAAAMTLVLVLAALVWSIGRYGLPAVCVGASHAMFYGGRWLGERENAAAAFVVIAAFAMLALGAAISWRKHAILAAVDRGPVDRGPDVRGPVETDLAVDELT
jgi:hypothetical protein